MPAKVRITWTDINSDAKEEESYTLYVDGSSSHAYGHPLAANTEGSGVRTFDTATELPDGIHTFNLSCTRGGVEKKWDEVGDGISVMVGTPDWDDAIIETEPYLWVDANRMQGIDPNYTGSTFADAPVTGDLVGLGQYGGTGGENNADWQSWRNLAGTLNWNATGEPNVDLVNQVGGNTSPCVYKEAGASGNLFGSISAVVDVNHDHRVNQGGTNGYNTWRRFPHNANHETHTDYFNDATWGGTLAEVSRTPTFPDTGGYTSYSVFAPKNDMWPNTTGGISNGHGFAVLETNLDDLTLEAKYATAGGNGGPTQRHFYLKVGGHYNVIKPAEATGEWARLSATGYAGSQIKVSNLGLNGDADEYLPGVHTDNKTSPYFWILKMVRSNDPADKELKYSVRIVGDLECSASGDDVAPYTNAVAGPMLSSPKFYDIRHYQNTAYEPPSTQNSISFHSTTTNGNANEIQMASFMQWGRALSSSEEDLVEAYLWDRFNI